MLIKQKHQLESTLTLGIILIKMCDLTMYEALSETSSMIWGMFYFLFFIFSGGSDCPFYKLLEFLFVAKFPTLNVQFID